MPRSSVADHDLDALVGAFIIRWGVDDDVATQLKFCSPEIQWQVVMPKPPPFHRNFNGLVIKRILDAFFLFSRFVDLPTMRSVQTYTTQSHVTKCDYKLEVVGRR